jgi:8-oxo-dGTP pyrophosphatase MutT (NUDIX family)
LVKPEPGTISANALLPNLDRIRTALALGDTLDEIRNPHVESPVSESIRQTATPSSVLIVITDEANPQVMLTKRHPGIRFGGHLCFPGGRADAGETVIATALREAEEEIGLAMNQVDVLGSFGCYFSQAGYRIDPVVGIVPPGLTYYPEATEVASIHWISLQDMLNPERYKLTRMNQSRAYFGFDNEEIHVGGPTASLMIGFLEWLSLRISVME